MNGLEAGCEVLLALGGGAARGVAHIGVIRTLEAAGYRVAGVAGTSIGSVFGGMFCAGALDDSEDFVRALDRRGVLRLLDPVVPRAGLFAGERIVELMRRFVGEVSVQDLAIPFCAVASDVVTGQEVRLCRGELAQAIRASSGIPGLFHAYPSGEFEGPEAQRWLVDGYLASPVPVMAARELGPLPIVAVNVNRGFKQAVVGQGKSPKASSKRSRAAAWFAGLRNGDEAEVAPEDSGSIESRSTFLSTWRDMFRSEDGKAGQPGMIESVYSSWIILQHNLARAQFMVEPPALLIEPNMTGVGVFDFHLGSALVDEGERATLAALDLLG